MFQFEDGNVTARILGVFTGSRARQPYATSPKTVDSIG